MQSPVSSAANIPNVHPMAALSYPLNLVLEQLARKVHKALGIYIKTYRFTLISDIYTYNLIFQKVWYLL